MSEKELKFQSSTSKNAIDEIYNFNTEAFADFTDLEWSTKGLKKEMSDGWSLYSVKCEDEVIAAAFTKKENQTLLTKNSAIKLTHQGNGFSHMIKEWYEDLAKQEGVTKIVNYCPFDNFRMVSLNERHKYKKTGKTIGNTNTIIEWEKALK